MGDINSGRVDYTKSKSHENKMVDLILENVKKKSIVCFGDSHRSVFNNLDKIKCINTGAATAYNLCNGESTTGARKIILDYLKNVPKEEAAVLLAFGEIDCMEHIIKNSQRNDCSPATTVEDVAGRYINFID